MNIKEKVGNVTNNLHHEIDDIKPTKRKWHLFLKLIPLLIFIAILKVLSHTYGFEVLSLNALLTSLIAATTFLIGFLITGVISDYKEAEKIPGELASSLAVLYDEAYIISKNKKSKISKEFIDFHSQFVNSLMDWFYKKEKTRNIMDKLNNMNDYFAKLENLTQATFIARMKNEQNNIRKLIIRIHSIRETSFVQSAYAIVESLAFFLVVALLLLKLEPFYEALFFSLVVSFLVTYMIALIKDLDNPFEYSEYGEVRSEVSLKPLHDLRNRLSKN
jgi:hypothetical protein